MKKEKEETTAAKYNGLPVTISGHNKIGDTIVL